MVGVQSVWQKRRTAGSTGKSFGAVRDELTALFCKLLDENPGNDNRRRNEIELAKVLLELCNVGSERWCEG